MQIYYKIKAVYILKTHGELILALSRGNFYSSVRSNIRHKDQSLILVIP